MAHRGSRLSETHRQGRFLHEGRHPRGGRIRRRGLNIKPYGIDYGSITPKRGDCENLLVPVCLSASHMAFGSIRMEPVFFALGQVAGTAASMAVAKDAAVQDVPYAELSERLLADGQVITLR